ncbi:ABC transporter substrate-binding protein [Bailinhaonella thermotolerans]|uniref:Uncharacterized protein n=1 Tax=Bailinhaonella thermotolerans TaxID=1070861 RepID=A0A3A4B007_9ACTN|nr:ABC transporter substrate-binding protein [Bailinhaonella thermotolerans]RJL30790.1 hypothetical protein D5H75_20965 [Bailinhaonella thermotolerans]
MTVPQPKMDDLYDLFDEIVRRPPAFTGGPLSRLLGFLGLRARHPGEGDRPLPLICFHVDDDAAEARRTAGARPPAARPAAVRGPISLAGGTRTGTGGPRRPRWRERLAGRGGEETAEQARSREAEDPVTVPEAGTASEVAVRLAHYYNEKVPYTDINVTALGDRDQLRGLLVKACGELGRTGIRQVGPAPRFPLVTFLLWLCNTEPLGAGSGAAKLGEPGGDEAAKAREMRERIRNRGRTQLLPGMKRRDSVIEYLDRTLAAWLAGAAVVGATLGKVVSVVAMLVVLVVGVSGWLLQTWIRTRDWAGRRRYAWFLDPRRQPYLAGSGSGRGRFERFAVRAVERRHTEEFDKLLVHAFLEDLRQAYRRRRRRRAPWARTGYCVMWLDAVEPGDAGARFMRLVNTVREETGEIDPLVIVSSGERDPAPRPDPVRPFAAGMRDARKVYERWLRRATRPYGGGYLSIGLAPGSHRLLDDKRDRKLPRVPFPARRPVHWAAIGTLMAVAIGYVGLDAWNDLKHAERVEAQRARDRAQYCLKPDIVRVRDRGGEECVGVTDGGFAFDRLMDPVQKVIKRQNDEVGNKPHITLVYAGPMSVRDKGRGLLPGSPSELAGIAAHQRARNSAQELKLKVLVANVGERSRFADTVARSIVDRARRDPSIVGVVGLGQSVLETQRAIQALADAGLPIVGTVNTYDRTAETEVGTSPFYFRVAPPNSRQAAAAAYWARSGLPRDARGGGAYKAKTAAVLYDASPSDLYSPNLARDFQASFGEPAAELFPYRGQAELQQAVDQACKKRPDLYYYAGRASEFPAFLNDLRSSTCGGEGRLHVLAGDDVSRYVASHGKTLGGDESLVLHYTPLAARQAWQAPWVGPDVPAPSFLRELDAMRDQIGPDIVSSQSHAMLGHDAALAFTQAAQRAMRLQRGNTPTYGTVLYELRNTYLEQGATYGTTGLIDFGREARSHDPVNKAVFLVHVTGEEQRLVAVCGRLTTTSDHPCDIPAAPRPAS